MRKYFYSFTSLLTLLVLFTQCQQRPIEASFDIVRDVREWGTAVSAVIIDLHGRKMKHIDETTFSVYATTINPITGDIIADRELRTVKNVKVDGNLVTLCLEVRLLTWEDFGIQGPSPNKFRSAHPADAAMAWTNGTNFLLGLEYEVIYNGGSHEFTATQRNIVTPIFDDFVFTQNPVAGFTNEHYRVFIPHGAENLPLVLWNHGGGETYRFVEGTHSKGSKDSQLYANMGGVGWVLNAPESAVILAPQRGMGEGAPGYSRPGVIAYIEYLVNKGVVDRSRIYISGPSAGGAETQTFMQEFPNVWAAAVPICHGNVSEENAIRVASGGFPIWLTVALNETIPSIPPAMRLAYERFLEAGAHVYLTEWEDVFGVYHCNYDGHWSWIQVLNNEVHEDIKGQVSAPIMDWMFQHARTKETVFERY